MKRFKFNTGQFSTNKEYICKYYKKEINIKSDDEMIFSCENDEIISTDSKFYVIDDSGKKIKCSDAIMITNDAHSTNDTDMEQQNHLTPTVHIPNDDNIDKSLINKSMVELKKYLYVIDTKRPMFTVNYLCVTQQNQDSLTSNFKVSPKSHTFCVASIETPIKDSVENAISDVILTINNQFMEKLDNISDIQYSKTLNTFDKIKKKIFGKNYTKKYKVNSDGMVKLLTKYSRRIATQTGYPATHCFVSASVASILIDKVFEQNIEVKDINKLPYFVGRVENIDIYVNPALDYNDGKVILYKKSENLVPSLMLIYYSSVLQQETQRIRTKYLLASPCTCENYVQKFYAKIK